MLTLSKCYWIEVLPFSLFFLNTSQHLPVQQVPTLRIHQARVISPSITRRNVQSLTFYILFKMKHYRVALPFTNPLTILRVLVILKNHFIPLPPLVPTLISLRPCHLQTSPGYTIPLLSLNQLVTRLPKTA